MEWRLPLHYGVVAIEKGAFVSPSTTVANFYFTHRRIGVDQPGTSYIQELCADTGCRLDGLPRAIVIEMGGE